MTTTMTLTDEEVAVILVTLCEGQAVMETKDAKKRKHKTYALFTKALPNLINRFRKESWELHCKNTNALR